MNRFLLERQLSQQQKKYAKNKKKRIPKDSLFYPVSKAEEKRIEELGLQYQKKMRIFG